MRAPSNWSIVTVGAPMPGRRRRPPGACRPRAGSRPRRPAGPGATTMTPWTWDARSRSSVDAMSLPLRLERDEAQQVARLPCRRLNAEEHVRRTELLGLDRHDPQRPRPSSGEHPGRGVGVVAERGDGLLDPEPVSSVTPAKPLSTRDTVMTETPAWAATSAMTARRGARRPSCLLVVEPLEGGVPADGVHADDATQESRRSPRWRDSGRRVAARWCVAACVVLETEGDGVGSVDVRPGLDGQDDRARRAGRLADDGLERPDAGVGPRHDRPGRRPRSARSRPGTRSVLPRRPAPASTRARDPAMVVLLATTHEGRLRRVQRCRRRLAARASPGGPSASSPRPAAGGRRPSAAAERRHVEVAPGRRRCRTASVRARAAISSSESPGTGQPSSHRTGVRNVSRPSV